MERKTGRPRLPPPRRPHPPRDTSPPDCEHAADTVNCHESDDSYISAAHFHLTVSAHGLPTLSVQSLQLAQYEVLE